MSTLAETRRSTSWYHLSTTSIKHQSQGVKQRTSAAEGAAGLELRSHSSLVKFKSRSPNLEQDCLKAASLASDAEPAAFLDGIRTSAGTQIVLQHVHDAEQHIQVAEQRVQVA